MTGDADSATSETVDSGGVNDPDPATDAPADTDESSGATTTSPRYRWKGLSTFVTLFLVGFYPAFLVVALRGWISKPDGTVMGILTFAWLVAIAYAVGTDIMKDVQEIRNG